MTTTIPTSAKQWINEIRGANERFCARIREDQLPTARPPADRLVVTCMDPRVNLEAVGIELFSRDGALRSSTRIVRTLGAIADDRSLLAAVHLPGVREIAVLMHTDCGACLAWNKADVLASNLTANLDAESRSRLADALGEPTPQRLVDYLRAFPSPRNAVISEVDRLRREPWMPKDATVHGLLYELATGEVEIVVNGSDNGADHEGMS